MKAITIDAKMVEQIYTSLTARKVRIMRQSDMTNVELEEVNNISIILSHFDSLLLPTSNAQEQTGEHLARDTDL